MKPASFGLFAVLALVACSTTGATGPSGFLAGAWDQDTPGWLTVMHLQASNGSVRGTIQRVGPPGPGGQPSDNGSVAGTYSGGAFVLHVTYADNVGGGSYNGQIGSDGRLTGTWTPSVAPSDTSSFWFVRE